MTMQHQIHPDDERLAALAGGDPDVASDAALRAHVSGCARCQATVADLSILRTALSELPDLLPSRPLQLVPPVAERRASGAGGGWLRRLAAPIMAAGFGLVLVGAVGTAGINLGGQAGSAPTAQDLDAREGANDQPGALGAPTPTLVARTNSDSYAAASGASPATEDGAGAPGAPSSDEAEVQSQETDSADDVTRGEPDPAGGLFSDSDPRLPWLVVLGLGVGLLAAGIYLRFAVQPRAG
jgi:hypothetical protein